MNDLVGYARIKKDARTGQSPVPIDNFRGESCRVLEFARDGGVLVIDSGSTGLCMFDSCDIDSSFKCSSMGEYLCPPDLNLFDQTIYIAKLNSRKGGYSPILKNMLIEISLRSGKFDDRFLWQKQD